MGYCSFCQSNTNTFIKFKLILQLSEDFLMYSLGFHLQRLYLWKTAKLCCSILSCSIQVRALKEEVYPWLFMRAWACKPWCQDTASICRAVEGNACLVSGGQRGECVELSEKWIWPISCSSACTVLTQVQRTVKLEKKWGIMRIISKQNFSNKQELLFIYSCSSSWEWWMGS